MSRIFEALIIRPSLAMCQVAGYSFNGSMYYRTGEARSYDHPDGYRGPVAIFASRQGCVEEALPEKHFPDDASLEAHNRACAPWRYKLVGFVELVAVHQPGTKHWRRVWRQSWNVNADDSTLFYETRPIVETATAHDVAPLFSDSCVGCRKLARQPTALQRHQVSSHVRWQRVELAERFCP